MRILVLGGHGFIGCHATKRLCEMGHDVTVVDNHDHYGNYPQQEYDFVAFDRLEFLSRNRYDFIRSDIKDINWSAMPKFDVIVNLATCPDSRYINKHPEKFHDNFVYQNLRLLEHCSKTQTRFVFVSSSMVYGDFVPPVNERVQPNPVEPYGTYKYMVEVLCQNYARNRGLEYVIVRPSAVYGRHDVVVRVISQFARSAITKGELIVNDPTSTLDFTWVEDTAEMLSRLSVLDSSKNQIFNISRGRGRTLLEAAELVQRSLGGKIVVNSADNFYPKRGTLDMTKTCELLGWGQKVDIEQGIPIYLEWFTANQSKILDI